MSHQPARTLRTTGAPHHRDHIHRRAAGWNPEPIPAGTTRDEMDETLRRIADAMNASANWKRWTPRSVNQLTKRQRQMLKRLVTGHYAKPRICDDQAPEIAAPLADDTELLSRLASHGLVVADLLTGPVGANSASAAANR